jgi:hypothetical protein
MFEIVSLRIKLLCCSCTCWQSITNPFSPQIVIGSTVLSDKYPSPIHIDYQFFHQVRSKCVYERLLIPNTVLVGPHQSCQESICAQPSFYSVSVFFVCFNNGSGLSTGYIYLLWSSQQSPKSSWSVFVMGVCVHCEVGAQILKCLLQEACTCTCFGYSYAWILCLLPSGMLTFLPMRYLRGSSQTR